MGGIKFNNLILGVMTTMFLGSMAILFQNCGSQGSGTGLTLGSSSSPSTSEDSPIIASISPSTANSVVNKALVFSVNASGGTGVYNYNWQIGSATGTCSPLSSVCTVSYPSTGTFNIIVSVGDAKSTVTSSAIVTVTSTPTALTASLAPTSATAVVGETKTFTATASGGQSPYTYTWTTTSSQLSCSGTSSCSVKYGSTGSFSVSVSVKDALGSVKTATSSITVSSSPPPPTDCSTSVGKLEKGTQDSSCYVLVVGWAWNPNVGQSTKVKIVDASSPTNYVITTISQVRDDVHASNSCVPASPTGKPGFSTYIPLAASTSNYTLKGYVLNSDGSVASTLNSLTVTPNSQCGSVDYCSINPCFPECPGGGCGGP